MTAIDTFVARARQAWGPLTSRLVAECRQGLEELAQAPASEPWLADLHAAGPANAELHRDAQHGFVLMAHTETAGLYRPPHDHGRAWVVYGLQQGAIEIRTFVRIEDLAGPLRLVQRDAVVLRPGQAYAYLPGDIHDTRCLSKTALLFRFTERDLKHEDRVARRLTRYPEPAGGWSVAQ
jgi:hypothetical protein